MERIYYVEPQNVNKQPFDNVNNGFSYFREPLFTMLCLPYMDSFRKIKKNRQVMHINNILTTPIRFVVLFWKFFNRRNPPLKCNIIVIHAPRHQCSITLYRRTYTIALYRRTYTITLLDICTELRFRYSPMWPQLELYIPHI